MILGTHRIDSRIVSCWLCVVGAILLAPSPQPAWAAGQTIYVKVLVDEEEATNESAWHRRLSHRLELASDVISKYCSLRFAASCYGTWDSDDDVHDLSRSLREFEIEVSPSPAQIAVGFTSQYRFRAGRNNVGGTRGPLRSHILIREGTRPIHETERVEVLIHELGHFLGAAHSRSPGSVMRPDLGDGLARSKHFQIHFDPDNARVIRLVAAEIRDLRVRRFEGLSERTKRLIRTHYVNLVHQIPNDPTARRYIDRIDRSLESGPRRPGPVPLRGPRERGRSEVDGRNLGSIRGGRKSIQDDDGRRTQSHPTVRFPKIGDPHR